MTSSQIQVLMVPGYSGSGPGHWQSLWEARHPEYRRVHQKDWFNPHLEEWVENVAREVKTFPVPVIAVGHSLGCITIVHYLARYPDSSICGILLVAPADVERESAPDVVKGFAPIPLQPLPCYSIMVASDDDPYLSWERAERFASAWRCELVKVHKGGHLDTAAGFGEWRQGEILLQRLIYRCMKFRRKKK